MWYVRQCGRASAATHNKSNWLKFQCKRQSGETGRCKSEEGRQPPSDSVQGRASVVTLEDGRRAHEVSPIECVNGYVSIMVRVEGSSVDHPLQFLWFNKRRPRMCSRATECKSVVGHNSEPTQCKM